jgi:hypothetical protein
VAEASRASLTFEELGLRWNYDPVNGTPGLLEFDFDRRYDENFFSYNQLGSGQSDLYQSGIRDFRLGANVTPRGEGLEVVIQLSNATDHVRARVAPDGAVFLESQLRGDGPVQEGGWEPVDSGQIKPLTVGRATRLEIWHVDQRVSLRVDDSEVLAWAYDRDPESEIIQRRYHRVPIARLGVRGAEATLRSVCLDRDLYYIGGSQYRRGTIRPVRIARDRFFCMGDNSPSSSDGRQWNYVDEWVRHLTTDPNDPLNFDGVPAGFVPRELMIGRAFFVYYPAPWRLIEGKLSVIPNFGDMRFIR